MSITSIHVKNKGYSFKVRNQRPVFSQLNPQITCCLFCHLWSFPGTATSAAFLQHPAAGCRRKHPLPLLPHAPSHPHPHVLKHLQTIAGKYGH